MQDPRPLHERFDRILGAAIRLREERDRLALALSEANRQIGLLRHAAQMALDELDEQYVPGREETQEAAQTALRAALRKGG